MLDEPATDPRQLIAELRRERDEALEQQAAIAEVLQAISRSTVDLDAVLHTVVTSAIRLCRADQAVIYRNVDGVYRWATGHSLAPEYERIERNIVIGPGPGTLVGRAAMERRTVQIADCWTDPLYEPKEDARVGGVHSMVGVPLLRDGAVIGVIGLARRRIEPYSAREIELVTTFADQAVIAIENARLINETREALEQQTATAEVLQVINASPGDLAPVFETTLDKALDLCGAAFGTLWICEGDLFRAAALRHVPKPYAEFLARQPIRPAAGSSVLGQIFAGNAFAHILDVASDAAYQNDSAPARSLIQLGGFHTVAGVPLRKDGKLLGAITIYRREVRAFTDKQIALLQNFAAQAVIAIENARLITETREALEQQTATAEVLQVINSSPGDLASVFDAMLEKAMRLCEAQTGHLLRFENGAFSRAASLGIPEEFDKLLPRHAPMPDVLTRNSVISRLLMTKSVIHISDLRGDESYQMRAPAEVAAVEVAGIRTALFVPLLREGEVFGAILMHRLQVRPFTEKQIALLQNFAAQAVIAIENARLLNELRDRTRDLQESLEYQTAISDVLKVISQSTFDLQPVLNSVSVAAARLCGGDMSGIAIRKGDVYQYVGAFSVDPEWERIARGLEFVPGRDTLAGRVILTGQPVHIPNLATDPEYALTAAVSIGKIRTALGVPLLREGQPIGVIFVGRYHEALFTERQIDVVRTFADQAVIAIENARLLNELRDRTRDLQESLEYQTATSDVLKVISRSTFDLQPVLDAVTETSVRLCTADAGHLAIRQGEGYRTVATCGVRAEHEPGLRSRVFLPGRDTVIGRSLLERRIVHVADLAADPEYGVPSAINVGGSRTVIAVPLMREGEPIGVMALSRHRVEPYSERQIELIRTFADQAVIAIENTRLLNEIRQRQAELRVTFDNMGDGVAMFDAGTHLVAWNRNFQQILDLPDDFVAARPSFAEYFDYLARRGEYDTKLEAELRRTLSDAEREVRFERTRPDGRVIEVRRNAVPGGGFVLIVGDITERKRAEAAIRAARDAAEKALSDLKTAQASLLHAQKMAALGQLTAGIAHEIKNPLNFVNNFAGLSNELLGELKEMAAPALAALDEDARADIDETIELLTGNLEKIAEHGHRADNIVKSMLAHSRGSSGERQRIDLNALIDEALNLAYHGARAQDQNFNITMERDFDASLAPVELVPQDMMRVFLNLIGNGFHAAHQRRTQGADPGFRPMLSVRTRDLGDAVEARVRDNGIGILPEHRDRLFQPFFTTKPTGEGTGLGLSISYDIVTQEHGGTITVDSEPGMFTEFTVRLPRAERSRPRRARTTERAA